ncbi:MAG: HlyD family efflux transporter periplasmic adaptor subunit [Phycisphaeraceae bacterium]|nr:HlyD family efflux transporter periplasmic adaptor subunit [Phycisphaeraceae bacterium]MCW5763702.1 HlyD family efflux transporter periplasmic adaptor subunit [Phycisphaeraceae bacterium]
MNSILAQRMSGLSRRGGTLTMVVVSIVLLGLVVGTWMLLAGDDEAKGARASTTELVAAERGTFEITTLATGELEAKNRIEMRSQLLKMGTIVEIVPEGSIARAGDVLVRLNSDTIEDDIVTEELALAEAQAELMAAQTALEIQRSENESRLRKAELEIVLADLSLKQWLSGEVERTRKDQQLAIEQAERQVERLEAKFMRSEELLERKFISQDERDLDLIAFINAKADQEKAILAQRVYEEYQYPRDEKQKQSDLDEAIAELDRVRQENEINITSRQATVANRERQVGRREQRLADLRQQFAACTVVAPSTGLVVYGSTVQSDNFRMSNEGPLQVGRNVAPNDLLIVLPDVSEMVARVRVHESLAGRVRPGQSATIQIDAIAQQVFSGVVASIGVMAEGGGWRDPNRREYTVRVVLNPGQDTDLLKPSMRCEARIQLGRVDDVVNVPIQAVFIDGAVTYVYMSRGVKFTRVPVMIGRRSDTRAEILSGLDAGARVLLRSPTPGEVLMEPWSESSLLAAGYTMDETGSPVAPVPARMGANGGTPGMPPMPRRAPTDGSSAKPASQDAASKASTDSADGAKPVSESAQNTATPTEGQDSR